MNFASNVIGLAGHALLWGVFLAWLLRKHPRRANWLGLVRWRVWLLPVLALLSGLAWYSRGITSDISITGMGLAYCWLQGRSIKMPLWLLAGWVVLGALLYASTLGLLAPDWYASGFQPQLALVLVLLWVLINGYLHPALGWILSTALALFAVQAMNSVNLFDYLLDPVTWSIFVCLLVGRIWDYGRDKLIKAPSLLA